MLIDLMNPFKSGRATISLVRKSINSKISKIKKQRLRNLIDCDLFWLLEETNWSSSSMIVRWSKKSPWLWQQRINPHKLQQQIILLHWIFLNQLRFSFLSLHRERLKLSRKQLKHLISMYTLKEQSW